MAKPFRIIMPSDIGKLGFILVNFPMPWWDENLKLLSLAQAFCINSSRTSSGILKEVVSTKIPCDKDLVEQSNKNRNRVFLIILILLIWGV